MLHREITAVCCGGHTEHKNTLFEKNPECLMLSLAVRIVTAVLYMLTIGKCLLSFNLLIIFQILAENKILKL